MIRPKLFSRLVFTTLVIGLLVSFAVPGFATATALDEYITAPDPAYAWAEVGRTPLPGVGSIYNLALTSQVWQGIPWQHRIHLAVPAKMKRQTVLLFITGSGSGSDEIQYAAKLAASLQAPVAVLQDIPNQPLFNGLREDALIALSFGKFVETQDATWPLLLPMTKAAVRAMDAVEEMAKTKLGFTPDGFVITGASKRGWTTWLTGAVDVRVKGIAPIVYDNLNLQAQMDHQITSWGKYSPQISDYSENGLTEMLRSDAGKVLADIVDPYAYRDRYNIPKLIIEGTNDPYWPVDAVNLYWNDLPAPSWIHYDPNGGHGLTNYERVLSTLAGFYLVSTGELPLQPVTWQRTDDGAQVSVEISSTLPVAQLTLWSAEAPVRDFRSANWSDYLFIGRNTHTFPVSRPEAGYKAFYAEVVYKLAGLEIAFETPMQVIAAEK